MKTKIILLFSTAMAVAFFAMMDGETVHKKQDAKVSVIRASAGYAHIQEPGHDVETVPFHQWCRPKDNIEGQIITIQKVMTTLPNSHTYTDYDSQSVREAVCDA